MPEFGRITRRSVLGAAAALGASGVASARATATPPEARNLTVVRDTWGTPHVYADTRYDLFYGYGFSIAEDRLFQLDMARRSFTGRVAEVLGAGYVDYDRSVRSSTDIGSLREQYSALSGADRDIFEGYAAGVNAHIREVSNDRARLLPKQYLDSGFEPGEWSGIDVVMVFVGTMANRFSDTTAQPENLATLHELLEHYGARTGREVFDQIVWRDDPTAPTTVPPTDSTPRGAQPVPSSAWAKQSAVPALGPEPEPELPTGADSGSCPAGRLAAQLGTRPGEPPRFSNAWLIGGRKTDSGEAILVNGPQFGFFQPAYTYSIGLHGAGFDVVGNTPFGYPAILFGHNEHIAWGSTAGMGASVDIFAEQLHPRRDDEYLFDGSYRRMARRGETIYVRDAEPVEITAYSTVHGPVTAVDLATRTAYSKRRSWAGYELESLLGWIHSTRAHSWTEWLEQARRNATTINWYYADRQGNIGYVHTGKYPVRHPDADPRLPVPGTGEMEWRGLRPFSWNPRVFNPEQGFLANWNNKPAANYEGATPWSGADRVHETDTMLRDRPTVSARQAWDMIERTSLVDLNARYFLDHLRRAVAALPDDSPEARAVALLDEWDGTRVDHDGDGRYDHPGCAIMRAWVEHAVSGTLADLPPETYRRFATSGYLDSSRGAGSVNVSPGTHLVHNALLGREAGVPQRHDLLRGRDRDAVVREALTTAVDDLSRRFGSRMRDWLEPVVPAVFEHTNFAGIPQADPAEEFTRGGFLNRGSENDIVVAGPRGIRAAEVAAPGQSGFVAPDGTTGRHYRDQTELFFTFRNKPVWFTRDEVLAHRESVRALVPR